MAAIPHIPAPATKRPGSRVLLEGRAGLVNERCATYLVHGSSHSSALSADIRFMDLCKVMEEISAIAKRKIPDLPRRLQIQELTHTVFGPTRP